jgi:hypothetical protein
LTSAGEQSGKLTLISTSRGIPAVSTRRMMSGAKRIAVSQCGGRPLRDLYDCDSATEGMPRMVPSTAPATVPE